MGKLSFELDPAPEGGGCVNLAGLVAPVTIRRMHKTDDGGFVGALCMTQHAAECDHEGFNLSVGYAYGQPAIEISYRGEIARIELSNELATKIANHLGEIADAGGEREVEAAA
jgi:hypothetical protein